MTKILTSILLALIYIIVALPVSFQFTDSLLKPFNIRTSYDNCPGLPTVIGSIAHAVIFTVVAYIVLVFKDNKPIANKIEKFTHPDTLTDMNRDEL